MSKYFSKDSDIFNYAVTEDDSIDASRITPSTDNLTQPLSEETKQYVEKIKTENNEIEYCSKGS